MEGASEMTRLARPQTLRGFRDLLPDEMAVRNRIIERVRAVYESYGYLPLDTPVVESLTALAGTGGDETDKQIFHLLTPEEQRAGLRFDLTVPFARVIAQYHPHTIQLPFRRYHIGPVFRADDPHPDQGRFRQFSQLDIDIAGANSIGADAEIAAVMSDVFEALDMRPSAGVDAPGYTIRFNNRKLMDCYLGDVGISTEEQARHVLRVLDKSDKVTRSDLAAELGEGRTDSSGDRIPGVGLAKDKIDAVLEFTAIGGGSRREVFERLQSRISENSSEAVAAIAEVTEFIDHLDAIGVSEDAVRLDPSLARGLDYYTGVVFEGTLSGAGVGSVMGGGRYDSLVSRFKDEPVPAVGASIGLDRLVAAMTNLKASALFENAGPEIIVFALRGVDPAVSSQAASALRKQGFRTELYVGSAQGRLRKQLAYANERKFAVGIILGETEVADGTVTIKDLRQGLQVRTATVDNEQFRAMGDAGQRTVPISDMASTVAEMLGRTA